MSRDVTHESVPALLLRSALYPLHINVLIPLTIVFLLSLWPISIAYVSSHLIFAESVPLGIGFLLGRLAAGVIIPSFFVVFMLLQYAFACLNASAEGEMTPPEFRVSDRAVVWQYLILTAICLVPLIVYTALAWKLAASIPLSLANFISELSRFSGVTALLVLPLLVWSFLHPAWSMLIAMGGSAREALNPRNWGYIIRISPNSYVLIWGAHLAFVVVLWLTVTSKTLHSISYFLPLLIADILFLLGTVALFHLMGYLTYRFHGATEAIPDDNEAPTDSPSLNSDEVLLQEIQQLQQTGRIEAAIERLTQRLDAAAAPMYLHECHWELLRAQNDSRAMLAYAPVFLNLAILHRKEQLGLGVLRQCRALDNAFLPEESSHISLFAERALQAGQTRLGTELLIAAIRSRPNDLLMPEWALRAATPILYGDETEKHPASIALLRYAQKKTEDPHILAQIEQLLSHALNTMRPPSS